VAVMGRDNHDPNSRLPIRPRPASCGAARA
jgi:hypothetical protein